ncbi:hypothetical protein [uncultured Rhodospira sp.]|uniref:hypothetical protein n=1 Tax=uncultured Rhodospira sp. TaxID=1936189 RepID=UPI002629A224|nr:hypothetical protein [uncultured Rhodospira sp.]
MTRSTRLRRLHLLAIAAVLVLEAGIVAALFVRIAGSSVNHIGASPYLALMVALPGLVMGLAGLRAPHRLRRGLSWGLVGLSLAVAGAVVALDQFNILVEYETWLRRGMPDRSF